MKVSLMIAQNQIKMTSINFFEEFLKDTDDGKKSGTYCLLVIQIHDACMRIQDEHTVALSRLKQGPFETNYYCSFERKRQCKQILFDFKQTLWPSGWIFSCHLLHFEMSRIYARDPLTHHFEDSVSSGIVPEIVERRRSGWYPVLKSSHHRNHEFDRTRFGYRLLSKVLCIYASEVYWLYIVILKYTVLVITLV